MNEWVKSLVGYFLIVSVVTQMMPSQKYEQYIKLFTGFLLIVLFLQPVLKIRSANVFLEGKINEFVQEQEKLEEQIGIQSEEFQKKSEQIQQESQDVIGIEEIKIADVEVNLDD